MESAQRSVPSAAWPNANLLLLLQGQFVSQVGSQLFAVASFFWIKHATGSASLVGLLMMALALPAVVLGPIAGTVVDRHSRRAILIGCDLLDAGAMLALAALASAAPQARTAILGAILATTVFISGVAAFFRPAISAIVPDVVPRGRVAAANSLLQAAVQLSMFVGQGLGGVLFRVLGAPVLFLANGASYAVSAASESFLRVPATLRRRQGWRAAILALRADTAAGLAYVWRQRGLRVLLASSAGLNLFFGAVVALLPFYVEDFLGAKSDWYGYLMAAFGVGNLLGSLAAGAAKPRPALRASALLVSMLLFAAAQAALGLFDRPQAALALVASGGLLQGFIQINLLTLLQTTTPSELRGRVFGLWATLGGSLTPVGMAVAGVVADLTGQDIPRIYLACGGLQVLLTALAARSPHFRRFLATPF